MSQSSQALDSDIYIFDESSAEVINYFFKIETYFKNSLMVLFVIIATAVFVGLDNVCL